MGFHRVALLRAFLVFAVLVLHNIAFGVDDFFCSSSSETAMNAAFFIRLSTVCNLFLSRSLKTRFNRAISF